MKATTNQLKNRNESDLRLYILPFKKEPCFKIGITYDIYDRGSQLGFANFDWTAGYLIQAIESHTIAGIELFLKSSFELINRAKYQDYRAAIPRYTLVMR